MEKSSYPNLKTAFFGLAFLSIPLYFKVSSIPCSLNEDSIFFLTYNPSSPLSNWYINSVGTNVFFFRFNKPHKDNLSLCVES